ncbi:UNVERIFIED_CONTAM: hypothetical protein PYX00_011939 [Menopon gallinae]|uniref:Probable acetate kinase n=1 Tax=Menopon gallinae TaxID=328185 RepID=A0AAW2H8X0_9NEOP
MNLIQQYIHSNESVTLDKIGSKSWEKRKSKARKKVDGIAEHLIELYSQRQQAQGFTFHKDDEWQLAFESAFPYNETPDQIKAMQEIKNDMQSPKPMDRLLCGDVGFGKTELAMRSAFKAVMSGKQVAVLSPTTILAEQHYESFKERFKNFPITISSLTRFTETKKQKERLLLLAKGEVDILIGTHRLLSSDVHFKNLGLLIIDEEQRFGVKAKEKLKSLRINLDILTLSATPIPRTLHISLLKLRDISTLTTPPINRKPIETIVAPFSEEMVKLAIEKELARNGQIFFLHNRIETLLTTKKFLERLVPYASIECAHGRMSGEELETLMHRFTHNHFQVLLSTSIIENGIDIPNANTIIVDQAQLYGLAQLYQLRGRVGRRGEEAYAYLLYPAEKSLSEQAIKRLEVLSENTALGSGFRIAMRDLEIRGIGNLLGSQQSGEIESVGLDMYLRLLEESMASRLGSTSQLLECHLDLSYQGFIPSTYIACTQEKMEIYKRLAAIKNTQEVLDLRNALYDRFGPLPQEMEPFLQVAELRVLANKLKISSLTEREDCCKVNQGVYTMKVLILNCGSSSVKYQVYDWQAKEILATGVVERVANSGSYIEHSSIKGEITIHQNCSDHTQAIELIFSCLKDPQLACLESLEEISVVGNRIVHGGERFRESVRVSDEIIEELKKISHLAPLHNPANIMGIQAVKAILPHVPQTAIFDTSWHQSLEEKNYLYALPRQWYEEHSIRRYGFHGTSYLYTARRASVLLGKKAQQTNLIIAHIGNGASINAVKNGCSYDTSMGFTPLEGLIMGTRCGDIDPAIVPYMMHKQALTPKEMNDILNRQSGILGITEKYIDRRDVEISASQGDKLSRLALEMEAYRIRKYIGAYLASLDGQVDAIVFTAGVGEMGSLIRELALENLEALGIELDKEKNTLAKMKS